MDGITIIFDYIQVFYSTFLILFGLRLLSDCSKISADKQDYVNAALALGVGLALFQKEYLKAHFAMLVICVIIWFVRDGRREDNGEF